MRKTDANTTFAPLTVTIRYFAALREARGLSQETLTTTATTPRDLYADLNAQYDLSLPTDMLQVAINHRFVDWETPLCPNDTVIFIPPVAGG
jgi:molybdopterin synthase sulfur carrier subunit